VATRTTQTNPDPTGTESLMPGDENEVTRPSDLGFGSREVELEPMIQEMQQTPVDEDGTVVVRMAETIEEFTHGNPHFHIPLEAGKQYRMPVEIARYLHSIGKLR
jgi:hypothetical protein